MVLVTGLGYWSWLLVLVTGLGYWSWLLVLVTGLGYWSKSVLVTGTLAWPREYLAARGDPELLSIVTEHQTELDTNPPGCPSPIDTLK